MYMIALYAPNYYEDKCFAHFKHIVKIYNHCAYILIIIKKMLPQKYQ